MLSNAPRGGVQAVGVTAMGVSILLPSLNRARETANRVKCASNERQIAMAILVHSNDKRGEYPPDLGTLVLTQEITPETFICPNDTTQLPDFAAMQPQQLADWVNTHSSYVFVGKGFNNNTTRPDQVILHEKPGLHAQDGLNFCFGDGHVEFVLMPQARKLIAETARGEQQPSR
jgi:prepilin-type processing-associated H-X9-DG protein